MLLNKKTQESMEWKNRKDENLSRRKEWSLNVGKFGKRRTGGDQ